MPKTTTLKAFRSVILKDTFRKKPIEIQAVRWTASGFNSRPQWLKFALAKSRRLVGAIWEQGDNLRIRTLEGVMTATPRDWVIQGVEGELYSCKGPIFAKTYERVTPTGYAAVRP